VALRKSISILIFTLFCLASPAWATWSVIQQVTVLNDGACSPTSLTCTLTSANTSPALQPCTPGDLAIYGLEIHNLGTVATTLTAVTGCGTATLLPSSGCNGFNSTVGAVIDCAYLLSETTAGTSLTYTRSNDDTGEAVWKPSYTELKYTSGPIYLDNYGTLDLSNDSTTQPGVTLSCGGTNDVVFQSMVGAAGEETPASPYNVYYFLQDHYAGAVHINTTDCTPPNPLYTSPGPASVGYANAIAFSETPNIPPGLTSKGLTKQGLTQQ
jgi:hypothetical protein